jgi:hypothetical protein
MERIEVERIFSIKKQKLIGNCQTVQELIAVLLGGQPASGKSTLHLRNV